MNYLYHKVPEGMLGNILYPLNQLKHIDPALYEKQKSKYIGREQVMLQNIPILNCLWNDVLHFTAIHPSEITKALKDGRKVKYYQINALEFDSNKAVVYLYSKPGVPDAEEFIPFDPDQVSKFSKISQQTLNYYNEMLLMNKKPLLYHLSPHILFKGSIDISLSTIIEA